MPIQYFINPELDLLVYVFHEKCTAREYFDLYRAVYRDSRRHHGMKILMDLSNVELAFELEDLHEAETIVTENKAGGFPPDRVVILTKSSSLKFLKKILVTLIEAPMHLEIVHTINDALRWLGLAEQEAAFRFWETCLQDARR